MLELAGIDADPGQAISSGRALDTYAAMIRAQGGDPDAPLPRARLRREVLPAPSSGWLTRLDALAVGVAAWRLGAGRARKEHSVQAGAGVVMHAKPGAIVRCGDPLLTLHTDDPDLFERALEALDGAFFIAPEGSRPDLLPLVIDRIG
jgi:thymidine phosphorylase